MDFSEVMAGSNGSPRIENRILANHVYDRIKQMIDMGELQPGERINKRALTEQLGVSQTPVNDALSRLAGELLVVQENRRGYFVRLPSQSELVDLFAVRAALEGTAARLCAELATDAEINEIAECFADFSLPFSESEVERYAVRDKRFHNRIMECSRSPMLLEMFERFGVIIKSNLLGLIRPPEETIGEHRDLIDALVNRSPALAQEVMTEHLFRSRTWLQAHLEKNA